VENPAAAASLRTVQDYMSNGRGGGPSEIISAIAHMAGDANGRELLGASGLENVQTLTTMHHAGQIQAANLARSVVHRERAKGFAKIFEHGHESGGLILLPPVEDDVFEQVKAAVTARVTVLEAISGNEAVFDWRCQQLPYQVYVAHLENKLLVLPLFGHDAMLSLFANKAGQGLHDGSSMTFSTPFPPGGITPTLLNPNLNDLALSLDMLDAIRRCTNNSSSSPTLLQLLQVVIQIGGNWYVAFSGNVSLPRVHSKDHFIFVFFHWLYVKWWQRTQVAFSVDASNIPAFVADISTGLNLHPVVADALTAFTGASKRPLPGVQPVLPSPEKDVALPLLTILPSPAMNPTAPAWTPEQKKGKPNDLPSFYDFRFMLQSKHWKPACFNFNKGDLPCHCNLKHAHICCICGQDNVMAFNHCSECSDAFRLGRGKSKAKADLQ
jgi:hypothetical protein